MIRVVALLLMTLLAACAPTRELEHAPNGDQFIVLWHKPSNERVAVTYRSGGQYLQGPMSELDRIFRDRHTDETYPVDPKLIDLIADLRDRMVMPADTPIELLSGYRSPESNSELAKTNKYVARNSYHMKGQAADIRIPDMNSSALEAVAKTLQRGGVALYPDSRHVHVDTGPIRGWSVVRGKEAGSRAEAPRAAGRPVTVSKVPYSAPRTVTTRGGVPVVTLPPAAPRAAVKMPARGFAKPAAKTTAKKPAKGFVKTPWKPSHAAPAKPGVKARAPVKKPAARAKAAPPAKKPLKKQEDE